MSANPSSASPSSGSPRKLLVLMPTAEEHLALCRARYDVAGGGDSLRLELQCASASYKFVLSGEAQARGGAISGAWSESSRNASGTLEGRVTGDRIEATARGANFAANLALSTRGKRQSVTIEPQGATEVTAVSVTLNKR